MKEFRNRWRELRKVNQVSFYLKDPQGKTQDTCFMVMRKGKYGNEIILSDEGNHHLPVSGWQGFEAVIYMLEAITGKCFLAKERSERYASYVREDSARVGQ